MDAQTMLDYMGIMLDAEKLADKSFTVNLKLSGGGDYLLKIHHACCCITRTGLTSRPI